MAQASRVAIHRAASNPLPLPLTPPPIEQVWWWPVPTCPAPSSSPSPVISDGWQSGSGLSGPGSIVSRFGSTRCDIGRQPPLLSRCGRFLVSAPKFSCFEPPAPSCTGMAHSTSAARIPAASAHSTSARSRPRCDGAALWCDVLILHVRVQARGARFGRGHGSGVLPLGWI